MWSTESLAEYNDVIHSEYKRVLHERLDPEQMDDMAARREALQPEIEWFENQVNTFVEDLGMKGKDHKMVKNMLQPVLRLVSLFKWVL